MDNEEDELGGQMDENEIKLINEAFDKVYKSDAGLRKLLQDNVDSLGPLEKKQILLEIQEKGGVEGLLEEEQE